METIIKNESAQELIQLLELEEKYENPVLSSLAIADSKYLRDLKMNLKTSLKTDFISEKEGALIALSIAVNENNKVLINYFTLKSKSNGATNEEIAETIACASLLSSNNVLYRFRHFTGKEKYNTLPARLRMSIMMNPVLGKEFFELISTSVSATNGCEMCVNSHEHSLIELGSKEERVFDAVKIASVVVGLSKIIY